VALDRDLIRIIACPIDKGSLIYFEDEMALYNPRLRRRYPIRDGVPVMLAPQAEILDGSEHDRLMLRAEAGDAVRTLG
jgi:uncharacterized protein